VYPNAVFKSSQIINNTFGLLFSGPDIWLASHKCKGAPEIQDIPLALTLYFDGPELNNIILPQQVALLKEAVAKYGASEGD
jgi:hypothetical protein